MPGEAHDYGKLLAKLATRLGNLDCVMVEIGEPHPDNPSRNVIPVDCDKLVAALSLAADAGRYREALEKIKERPGPGQYYGGAGVGYIPLSENDHMAHIACQALQETDRG